MIDTKAGEPLVFSPLEDEPAIENLPEPFPLAPEQMRAQAEADERDRQRQLEWAMVVQALNDNSLAVFRAMRRVAGSSRRNSWPHGRRVHQPAGSGSDPAGRALRPGHARGARGS